MDAPIFRFDRYNHPGPSVLTVGPRVSLEITRGRVQQRIRAVRSRVFLIGTASDCDLVLGDLSFPDAYAYLFVQDAAVTIRRLGAGPDLVVSGERVETAELMAGDRVAFGPFELRVIIDRPLDAEQEPTGSLADEAGELNLQGAEPTDQAMLLLSDLRLAFALDQTGE
jgi:type III secretion system (T3SS) inner membrane Yop/YscD-like protein